MATIKVKLRYSTGGDKTATVCYRLTHRREVKHVVTDIRFRTEETLPVDWMAVKSGERYCPDASWLLRPDEGPGILSDGLSIARIRIEHDIAELRRIIRSLESRGASYTVEDVAEAFRTSPRCVSVLAYIRRQIDLLKSGNRFGTAYNYERALRSLASYLGGTDLPLAAVTDGVIDGYNAYLLRRGVVRNSVSFYMRILRAVYNKAVGQRLIEQAHPFRNVYTGIDRTRKRAVEEREIARLWQYALPAASPLALARDLFVFSYCTRGMAFVDVAYLRKADIRDGAIRYSRRKTGQPLCIRIEPDIRKIIDRYAETTRDTPYVFPILNTCDPVEAYAQYQMALNTHNRMLKKLARMLSLPGSLTSYTSRHSWATAARNHQIPITVISAGLGHTSERTTQIYLALLENSVIDAANRGIIASLSEPGSV